MSNPLRVIDETSLSPISLLTTASIATVIYCDAYSIYTQVPLTYTALTQKEVLSPMRFEEIDSTVSPRTCYFSGNNTLDAAELIGE